MGKKIGTDIILAGSQKSIIKNLMRSIKNHETKIVYMFSIFVLHLLIFSCFGELQISDLFMELCWTLQGFLIVDDWLTPRNGFIFHILTQKYLAPKN